MTLPSDGHVHSEWSWDAANGAMERSCARAVDIGLPSIAFTDHLDHTTLTLAPGGDAGKDHLASLATPEGLLTPPEFDAAGYVEAIERCRHLFPSLRILSGAEIGEPHWHQAATARVLGTGTFDRVAGVPALSAGRRRLLRAHSLVPATPAAEVIHQYLAEVVRLVTDSDVFSVLAHIDYPLRSWPAHAGRFDPSVFEEDHVRKRRPLARNRRPRLARRGRHGPGTRVPPGTGAV